MANTEQPQIYLVTPPEIDLNSFPDLLARVIDTTPVACLRVALSSTDETLISKTCDTLQAVTSPRDIALVIERHVNLVEKLGLDGVHLIDGARLVRKLRKSLGQDMIVGAYCGDSRHEGLNAAEAGADYVAFGPVGKTALGDGALAEQDLFNWWSEMIEIPVVAEGGLDKETITTYSNITDFLCLGSEVWTADDPASQLKTLVSYLG